MGKVLYLGQACYDNANRIFSPASNTLISYVTEAVATECEISVISSAPASGKVAQRECVRLENGTVVTYLPLVMDEGASSIKKLLLNAKNKAVLKKELFDSVQDGDTLIVYHSLGYIDILTSLRKKRKFTLILQVCEIYSDVSENKKERKAEVDFIKTADKYIFSSKLLNDELNVSGRPYVICHGTYKEQEQISTPAPDGKTHLLYAGTFNPIKGGVFNAIASTEFLDENYHLHILGGAEEMLLKVVIKEMILASAKSSCQITYDGYLTGEKYVEAVQGCHIGLSTQDGEKAYSETSFPSKILVYMANGLKVVSGKIPAVTTSDVSDAMFYYEHQAPRMIADAIKAAALADKNNSKAIINDLNAKFKKDVIKLLRDEE